MHEIGKVQEMVNIDHRLLGQLQVGGPDFRHPDRNAQPRGAALSGLDPVRRRGTVKEPNRTDAFPSEGMELVVNADPSATGIVRAVFGAVTPIRTPPVR